MLLDGSTISSQESSKLIVPQYKISVRNAHNRQKSHTCAMLEQQNKENRHFANLNLANYQKAEMKGQFLKQQYIKPIPELQKVKSANKILEKNEGQDTISMSSYEESIESIGKDPDNSKDLRDLQSQVHIPHLI